MYRRQKPGSTSLKINESWTGETIEQKIERITINKEPIKDGAPLIHTEREEGVVAAYDPRTDRFEVAIDAMDKVTKSQYAKRKAALEAKANKDKKPEANSETEVSSTTSKQQD